MYSSKKTIYQIIKVQQLLEQDSKAKLHTWQSELENILGESYCSLYKQKKKTAKKTKAPHKDVRGKITENYKNQLN